MKKSLDLSQVAFEKKKKLPHLAAKSKQHWFPSVFRKIKAIFLKVRQSKIAICVFFSTERCEASRNDCPLLVHHFPCSVNWLRDPSSSLLTCKCIFCHIPLYGCILKTLHEIIKTFSPYLNFLFSLLAGNTSWNVKRHAGSWSSSFSCLAGF